MVVFSLLKKRKEKKRNRLVTFKDLLLTIAYLPVNLYLCLSFTISTSEVGWGSCPRSSASDYVFVYCLRLEGGLVLEDRGTWQHWQLTVKVNFVLVLVVAGEDSNRCCPVTGDRLTMVQ